MNAASNLHPGPDNDLQRMVAASLAGALDAMVRRKAEGDRLALIQTLRAQMQRILAKAPVTGDLIKAGALRSQMAALFDAEFTRLEAAGERQEPP